MRVLKRIGLLTAALLLLSISLLQLGHLIRFGHFFPFGLHADVTVRKVDYGIEGITKAYEAKLTNYGIMPAKITACDFVDDAMERGTIVCSGLQKWNPSAKKWEDAFKTSKFSFCHPYPLGMIETHLVTKQLWFFQSISAGEEATAARDIFVIGDKARFLVFAVDDHALSTAAFSIDEHPIASGVPYRVRH